MPVGSTYPTPSGAGAGLGPETVFGAPAIPAVLQEGTDLTGSPAPSWFRRSLPVEPIYVPDYGGILPVATLPAPGPGTSYVLERIVITTGASIGNARIVLVAIGTSLTVSNVMDSTGSTEEALVVQSDPNPWRLSSTDSLWIVFVNGAEPNQGARVQVRIEAGS